MATELIRFLQAWGESIWQMLTESSLLLLLGLLLAGLLHLVLNEKNIPRLAGKQPLSQVLRLALIGVPLPLCSCSVLPIASQLRKAGVSRGGTTAFLIATPETGAESILLTWSLMNPVMTVARPISAFLAAMLAGIGETLTSNPDSLPTANRESSSTSSSSSCGCPEPTVQTAGWLARLAGAVRYGFVEVLGDIAFYLVMGYLLAGLVGALIGPALADWFGSATGAWSSYAAAVVVGVPLYVCATSSTPLAAALMASGMSPGAVLVFLLVGPATNLASIAVVGRILGRWGVVRYLVSIVVVALASGLIVDAFFGESATEAKTAIGSLEHIHASWYDIAASILLVLLISYVLVRNLRRRAKAACGCD